MAGQLLNVQEERLGERKQVDCVEIYLPKSIEFLSELYRFLRETLDSRLGPISLDGFSIYEVDGVFRGQQTWEQRTLVIRLMFIRPRGGTASGVEARITMLGREIASMVAGKEEEIWICHFPQTLRVFQSPRKVLS